MWITHKQYLIVWDAALFISVYGGILALFSIGDFPKSLNDGLRMPYLYDEPVGEDGFYMLMVAWNLATGNGITGNFFQPVTGIQLLSTFIYAAIARVVYLFGGNKDIFVRAIIFFGSLNLAIYSFLLGSIAQKLSGAPLAKRYAYIIAALVTVFSFHAFRVFTYGLETGIYLTIIAYIILISFDAFAKETGPSKAKEGSTTRCPQGIVLGVLVGLAGLARIDFGLVFAVFIILSSLVFRWNSSTILTASVASITALILVCPWLIYVWNISGTPIPSSGPAQGSLVTLGSFSYRLIRMGNAAIQNISPWFFTAGR